MVKRLVLLGFVFTLVLSSGSCTKLVPTFTRTGPSFPVSVMPVIPLDTGELVAVTPHPIDGHWVALWFQKPDKTISVRWVNITIGTVGAEMTIPRK
ncbi:MAG: hypothetical protein AUH88_01845 [Acidobacteria bacterium 13_1_40CM_4_61_5]|nr:MAG: hypothetical protein AUH88_01845 [Acidobacteria bacterium 13_1_40CM_4_61_5]